MNTIFLLMAQYDGKADIPLTQVAKDYLGLSEPEAKKKAAMYQLPFPAYRAGSAKSPWVVRVGDLAKYLDEQRAAAEETWKKMNG